MRFARRQRKARDRPATAPEKIRGPADCTRPVETDEPARLPGALFGTGIEIRITLIRCNSSATNRLAGATGTLLDALMPGRPLRIRVDDRVLVTSDVRSLAQLGVSAVQVVTGNSTYRIDRHPHDGGSPEQTPAEAAASNPPGRLPLLRRLSKRLTRERAADRGAQHPLADRRPPRAEGDETCFVALAGSQSFSDDSFAPGTPVLVARSRGQGVEPLGLAHLLDPVELGAPLRFSLAGGPTLATTAVRSVEERGSGALDLGTANSTYHLRRVPGERR